MKKVIFTCILLVTASAMAVASVDVSLLLGEVVTLYEAGDYPAAEKKLIRVLEADPSSQVALYYMGMSLYNQGRGAEAIPYLEKTAAGSEPLEGLAAFLAGLYLSEGQVAKALPYYAEQYRVDPSDTDVAYRYALCLKGTRQWGQAKAIFRRLAGAEGDIADASRYELGVLFVEEGDYFSARDLFRSMPPNSAYAEAAASYIESLVAFTRPFGIYGSLDYFYDDNPASSSTEQLGQQTIVGASPGVAVNLLASTRHYAFTDDMDIKLQYTFYGNYYRNEDARAYDFVSQFFEPTVRWRPARFIQLTLGTNLRLSYFGGQDYSSAVGGNLLAEWTRWRGRPVKMHVAYTRTRYTDAYESAGAVSSLEYLDADTYTLGIGTDLVLGRNSLSLGYTFSYEDTLNVSDARFGAWARDSRYWMHAVSGSFLFPFSGRFSGVTAITSANYTRRIYPQIQSGELYPSVAGRQLETALLVLDARLQVLLWKKANMNLALGVTRTESNSAATAFDYVSTRYSLQLSASY